MVISTFSAPAFGAEGTARALAVAVRGDHRSIVCPDCEGEGCGYDSLGSFPCAACRGRSVTTRAAWWDFLASRGVIREEVAQ